MPFFPQTHNLLVRQKKTQTLFPTLHPLSLVIFDNYNSCGIFTASQFYVQLPLLYTAWSNPYAEIGPEVTLQPLAISCVKDYKGHSLVQTSFTEPPNSKKHQKHNLITLKYPHPSNDSGGNCKSGPVFKLNYTFYSLLVLLSFNSPDFFWLKKIIIHIPPQKLSMVG